MYCNPSTHPMPEASARRRRRGRWWPSAPTGRQPVAPANARGGRAIQPRSVSPERALGGCSALSGRGRGAGGLAFDPGRRPRRCQEGPGEACLARTKAQRLAVGGTLARVRPVPWPAPTAVAVGTSAPIPVAAAATAKRGEACLAPTAGVCRRSAVLGALAASRETPLRQYPLPFGSRLKGPLPSYPVTPSLSPLAVPAFC